MARLAKAHEISSRYRTEGDLSSRCREGTSIDNGAPHQAQMVTRWDREMTGLHDRPRCSAGKSKLIGRPDQLGIIRGADRGEPTLVKTNTRSRYGGKICGHIQGHVRAKNNARWIEEEQIGMTATDLN